MLLSHDSKNNENAGRLKMEIKTPHNCRAFQYLLTLAYFLAAYFFLNLSIRPAVSTNIFLPVKKGWEVLDISNLIRGYSFPSSHFTISLEAAVERLKKV